MLTDSEIKKALECCSKGVNRQVCEECAFRNEDNKININCFNLEKYALDLINRLQAENERLKKVLKTKSRELKNKIKTCDELVEEKVMIPRKIKTTKAEAYKEFAERLKERLFNTEFSIDRFYRRDIDKLLNEIVGEENASTNK